MFLLLWSLRLHLAEVLDVLLRSCVFVLMMIILCVIVTLVERNLVSVIFMCVDIISNFVLMMIILCVFCFLYLCMLCRLFGCTVEIMCFCIDDDNFMCDDDNFMFYDQVRISHWHGIHCNHVDDII
ncbi:hypothetical protein Hanom_Chr02g00120841 [Helianthus anomalus]